MQRSAGKRSRGRNQGRKNVPLRSQVFDSNGPDVRIRGTAHQVHEKYMALYRDANASGDRVMSENYLQHADHYYRIICAANAEAEARRNPPQPNGNAGDPAPVTEARPQQGDGTGQRAVTEPEPNGRDVSNSPEGTVDPGSAPQPEIVVLEGDGAAQEAAPAAERESRGSGQRRNGHGGRGGQRRGRSAQQKTEQPQTKPAPAGESAEPASPAPAAAPADAEPSA